MKLCTESAVQCLATAFALLSVSPEPPVCPSCQGDNTILLPGLNIISQFFHFSAPVINFWSLLHKILCNVFFRCLFFWSLLANGSGEGFHGWSFCWHSHAHERSPRPSPAVSVWLWLTQTGYQLTGVGGTTAMVDMCPQRVWGKQETRAVCQLLYSLVNIICFVVVCIILCGNTAEEKVIHKPSAVIYSPEGKWRPALLLHDICCF